MKKQLTTTAVLILFCISLNAQWQQQSSGTAQNLNDIYFINADTGLIVGNAGTILKTDDGGINWTAINIPGYYKLTSIDFVNDTIGYISCYGGLVLKTMDGGNSWEVIETGFFIDLEEVQSYYDGIIWACGDKKIIFSDDGGQTWELQFELVDWDNWLSLFIIDTNNLWAVCKSFGDDFIYRKNNNISNWDCIWSFGNDMSSWSNTPSIFFADIQNGWILHTYGGVGHAGYYCYSNIYHTSDLGDSLECRYTWDWSLYQMESMSLSDIYFVNNTLGWTVGGDGYIFKTENAGYDWEWQFSGTEENLRSVFFADTTNGWIVGDNGIILYTDNSGSNSCLCLPEGNTFTTQTQIDSFQISHPTCTEILGEVVISGNDITNLNGINMVTSIGEFLEIKNNTILTSLSGIDSLTSIGEDLLIWDNPALISLTGLENLTMLPGNLKIGGHSYSNYQYSCKGNSSLTDLNGLNNLDSIGGNFIVYCNEAITSLSGLESLVSIGGDIQIGKYVWNYYDTLFAGNSSLYNLLGLDNLTSIDGDIKIYYNESLSSLTGLDNIIPGTIENVSIYYNNSLSTCETQSLCDYLANPNGVIDIYNNANGCNSPPEIAVGCGSILPCLPHGNFYFFMQSDIDNFQTNYPDCFDLGGNVVITGTDITNLDGLSTVASIGGQLMIEDNPVLVSLSGLDNLGSVEEELKIANNGLMTSLSGLNNLLAIGGRLIISNNDSLMSLSGLINLTSIGGNLQITGNNILFELTGLDNIDPASIANINISNNGSLSICDVSSICHYLIEPNGSSNISNNAPGCSSPQEVEEACNCWPEGIVFSTQEQIDNYSSYVQNCTNIVGNVTIHGDDISNLNGLQILTSIEGDLIIQFNNNLIDISGLGNLKYVNGMFRMQHNSSLTTFSGLDSLTLTGDNLEIYSNGSLGSLSGLENLETIGNALKIVNNNSLYSLVGLENVNAGSIESLQVSSNDVLSDCHTASICDYLLNYNGAANISNNAPGCNSQEEVEEACLTGSIEVYKAHQFSILPHPIGLSSVITYTLENNSHVILKILDLSGREMETLINEYQQQGEQKLTFNTEGFKSGVYFFILKTSERIQTRKIIKL